MASRKRNQGAASDDWEFCDFPAIADRFGLSSDAVATLVKEKTFPVFSRKICPALMKEWLLKHSDELKALAVS